MNYCEFLNKDEIMNNSLLYSPVGSQVLISKVNGGMGLQTKLRQYGLFVGDKARILRLAPLAGPVLLEVNGREIALGRGIAAKIIVETI